MKFSINVNCYQLQHLDICTNRPDTLLSIMAKRRRLDYVDLKSHAVRATAD
jgi:hypothetical protein